VQDDSNRFAPRRVSRFEFYGGDFPDQASGDARFSRRIISGLPSILTAYDRSGIKSPQVRTYPSGDEIDDEEHDYGRTNDLQISL
jgi:hypothetical protein